MHYTSGENWTQALKIYDFFLASFTDVPDEEVRSYVLLSKLNRAVALVDSNPAEADRAFQDIIDEYSNSGDKKTLRQVAFAMFNRAGLMLDRGENRSASELLRALVSRFASSADPETKESVHDAKRILESIGPAKSSPASAEL